MERHQAGHLQARTAAAGADGDPRARVRAQKLYPPRLQPGTVQRDAILERVVRLGAVRVTLLLGPAGSGKSTAMAQILQAQAARGWATAWLSLDEGENDPRRFESHLQAMLASVRGEGVPTAARAPGVALHEWAAEQLDAVERPVALFFDDFHLLREASLQQFFRELFRAWPAWLRLYIGSRSTPDIGVSTLLVAGQATVLRSEELYFSNGEACALFAAATAPALTELELDLIHQRTEGWPAGLQLFRLALANPALRGSLHDLVGHGSRELAEYLADNVLSRQEPQLRRFLLRTSVLRRLSAPLCDAVLGGGCAAGEVLRRIEREGLFLSPIDPAFSWFRYHGLFAAHLRDTLERTDPQALLQAHRAAALWHFEQGSLEESVYHALGCHDLDLAAQALDRWAGDLIAGAELVTVERWYERLPLERVAQRPSLAIKVAWALIFLRHRDKLAALLPALQRGAQAAPARQGPGEPVVDNPAVVLSMAALFRDDLPGGAALAEAAPTGDPGVSRFASFELGAACNLLAFWHLARGRFEDARAMIALAWSHNERAGAAFSRGYTEAVEDLALVIGGLPQRALGRPGRGDAAAPRLPLAMASAAQAAARIWAAYEADELDLVEQLGERFVEEISRGTVPDFLALAYVAMSRAHAHAGRDGASQDTLDALERIALGSAWERVARMVGWERVRRELLAGRVAGAEAIVARLGGGVVDASAMLPISELLEGDLLGRVRLAVHRRDWSDAARWLAAAQPLRQTRRLLAIRLRVLEALMHQARQRAGDAQRALLDAARLAAEGGCVRALVDEGPTVVSLLQEIAPSILALDEPGRAGDGCRDFGSRLLRAAGLSAQVSRPAAAAAPLELLSEREVEILHLLCAGAANREIAATLLVSENTVKFHLKNLYAKLGVGSRGQAIAAANARQAGRTGAAR